MNRAPSPQIRRRFGKADFPSLPQMKMFAIADHILTDQTRGHHWKELTEGKGAAENAGRRGLDAFEILGHVLQNVAGRCQGRQDIDEPEHLCLEHRVLHCPFHQASVEILAPEEGRPFDGRYR